MAYSSIVDIEVESDNLMIEIDENLKKYGLSHRNSIEGDTLRGFGDAGVGVFFIQRKRDDDNRFKLFLETNNEDTAGMILNIFQITFEELRQKVESVENIVDKEVVKKDIMVCSACQDDAVYLKDDTLFGIKVAVYICRKCKKVEIYNI